MADVICQKCGYKTNTKEEDTERGSTCPICRGELKVERPKACGCILLIIDNDRTVRTPSDEVILRSGDEIIAVIRPEDEEHLRGLLTGTSN